MKPFLPQGYTAPPTDYHGEVYLESQMRAYARECEKEILKEALHAVIACGSYHSEEVLGGMIEADE